MPLLYPTSCKCSTESFVNSASPFPLLFFFDFLFFLESKGSKRKSIAGKLFFCAFGGLANVQRKTDGSHTSRPFFRCKLDVRENAFSTLVILSRFVFCFFSSRKEIVPLLFFLEEKKSFPKRNRTPSKLHEKAGRSFLSGLLCFAFAYSRMSDTTPDATVRPPSRIAKRSPFSIAIGVISVISMRMLSPGMTISTPSGSLIVPVTSVVRK